MSELLRVGQVAEKLGISPQTLYFYERLGLIPKPRRTEGGYRLYGEPELERLAFIARAKALGLTLAEIKELLLLQENGQALPCWQVYVKLTEKLRQIDKSIAHLQELRGELSTLIEKCQQKFSEQEKSSSCTIFQQQLDNS